MKPNYLHFHVLFSLFLVPDIGPKIKYISWSSTTLKVMWEKLNADNSNGAIISYEVCYQVGCTLPDCSQSNKVVDVNTAYLTGLETARIYTVAVRAFTAVGPGPLGISGSEYTKESGESK